VQALTGRFAAVRSVYLASEGGCGAGIVATEADLVRPGMAAAAGRPVPGADARVIDPDAEGLVDVAPGETGEIALAGPSLSPGYRGDAARTAGRFRNGWWRTGDLGRIGPEGLLHVAGRLDNRINSGGVKVHAEEVEAALLTLSCVRAAAVVGVPDQQWGERIEAHVVPADPSLDCDRLALAFAAATDLPRLLHPKRFHLHDRLPMGPTGKLYRRALREAAETISNGIDG
jgi:acyl-CoA synthetase (AMP-forming)/AMP-acid ligase II